MWRTDSSNVFSLYLLLKNFTSSLYCILYMYVMLCHFVHLLTFNLRFLLFIVLVILRSAWCVWTLSVLIVSCFFVCLFFRSDHHYFQKAGSWTTNRTHFRGEENIFIHVGMFVLVLEKTLALHFKTLP